MSELLIAQQKFPPMMADLIQWAYAQGYAITMGECYRTPQQAALNAESGAGITNSLHCDRLAVDLMLFKDGEYLTTTLDYQPLGEYWESIGGAWGGRFSKPDSDHFSIAFGGRK